MTLSPYKIKHTGADGGSDRLSVACTVRGRSHEARARTRTYIQLIIQCQWVNGTGEIFLRDPIRARVLGISCLGRRWPYLRKVSLRGAHVPIARMPSREVESQLDMLIRIIRFLLRKYHFSLSLSLCFSDCFCSNIKHDIKEINL